MDALPFVLHVRVTLVPLYDVCVPLAGWLASWGHLPVCVLFVCLCLGRSSGPPPHVILALSMQGPQSLHLVCVP